MTKQKKAARGKHRWIAFQVGKVLHRRDLSDLLQTNLSGVDWRLFDVSENNKTTLAIIQTPLNDYPHALSHINSSEIMKTITSSGKIKLVRKRLAKLTAEQLDNT